MYPFQRFQNYDLMSRINQQYITSNKIWITMVLKRETYNILWTQISPQ